MGFCDSALRVVCVAFLPLACLASRTSEAPVAHSEDRLGVSGSLFDTSAILQATVRRWRLDSAQAVASIELPSPLPRRTREDSVRLHHVWIGPAAHQLRELAQARGRTLLVSDAPRLLVCPLQLHYDPAPTDTLGYRVTLDVEIIPPNAARMELTQQCIARGDTQRWTEIYTLTWHDGAWRSTRLRIALQ
jgi:hypothetical protein